METVVKNEKNKNEKQEKIEEISRNNKAINEKEKDNSLSIDIDFDDNIIIGQTPIFKIKNNEL